MTEISYTNTINVNVSGTPQGMTDFVTANIGLFSNEVAGFADEYKVYVNASGVAEDFGSDSLTYKMANAIFAQSPNLRSGSGSLIVAPYVATSGTQGKAVTPELNETILSNFKTVTDGEIVITACGHDIKLSKLDFSSVKTLDDVVKVMNAKNPDVWISVDGKKIVFACKEVGTKSTISFSAGVTGTDITKIEYLNTADAVITAGTNAKDGEALSDAVTRVNNKIYFGGVLDTVFRENESIENNAKVIEAISKKVYIADTASLNNISVLGKAIKEGGYKKTKVVAYSQTDLEGAKCAAAAYLSKALCTNYNGSNTCITMNLKELATIDPDKNCGDSTFQLAKTHGVDIYGYTSGLGCTYSFKNAGGYMDDQTGIMAFVGQLEVAAFNYLKQTKTKLPQTETGMSGLKSVCANVCERFVTNGFFGKGNTWNSSEKFGDPEDFDRCINELGYYIYSIPIAQQAQSEREARIAPLIQIAAKSVGAIHIVNINGTIEA